MQPRPRLFGVYSVVGQERDTRVAESGKIRPHSGSQITSRARVSQRRRTPKRPGRGRCQMQIIILLFYFYCLKLFSPYKYFSATIIYKNYK